MKCIGPRGFSGCPYNADVLPMESRATADGVMTLTRYYHCAGCLEVYRQRYADPAQSAQKE